MFLFKSEKKNPNMVYLFSIQSLFCRFWPSNKLMKLFVQKQAGWLRGETVYVNFLVTVSYSLNISVVYFCNQNVDMLFFPKSSFKVHFGPFFRYS